MVDLASPILGWLIRRANLDTSAGRKLLDASGGILILFKKKGKTLDQKDSPSKKEQAPS